MGFLETLKSDINQTYRFYPGSRMRRIISCLRTPGVHAVIVFRFGQWLKTKGIVIKLMFAPIYLIWSHRIRAAWGIAISPECKIGKGFYIGHFGGIFIAGEAVIGVNFFISQGVTIGVSGQGENRGCPVIGDDVYIAAGAKIFGKIRIGNNVKIGANAVIHKDIPDNAIAVADPGFRIISMSGNNPVIS